MRFYQPSLCDFPSIVCSDQSCNNAINHRVNHLFRAVLGLLAAAPHRQAIVARPVAPFSGEMLAEKFQDKHAPALHLVSKEKIRNKKMERTVRDGEPQNQEKQQERIIPGRESNRE